jgi:quinohemoprotein amine dehydrogenase
MRPAVFIVYDRVDSLKVLPQAGLSRLGGEVFPKQVQQFEAVAFSNGPDGRPGSPDDLNLGLVNVAWSLEEYTATFGDDDVQFVGAIDQTGLFVPAVDGPNPKRSGNRNNVGDVWVVAELKPGGSPGGSTAIRARAHLLVTVPVYMAWFESEGGR